MLRNQMLAIAAVLLLAGTTTTLVGQASAVPADAAQPGEQLIKSQAELLGECERLDQQRQADAEEAGNLREICARARLAQALLLGERDLARSLVSELATDAPGVHFGHRDTRSPLSRGVNGMSRGQSEAFNRLLMGGLEVGGPFEAGAEFSLAADGGGSGDKPLWANAMGGDGVNMMGSRWQPMRGKRAGRRPLFAARRSLGL